MSSTYDAEARADTAPSSGPGQSVVLPAGDMMLTDPSEMQLDENVNCAP